MGAAVTADGKLTEAALTWLFGLKGLSVEQLGVGFNALVLDGIGWPPSLPEFRRLCLQREDVPCLSEVVRMLVCVRSRTGTLAYRYQHPLVLALSCLVDGYALRTAKTAEAERLVRPHYQRLLSTGWPDWPDHAFEHQQAITLQPTITVDYGREQLSNLRGLCG